MLARRGCDGLGHARLWVHVPNRRLQQEKEAREKTEASLKGREEPKVTSAEFALELLSPEEVKAQIAAKDAAREERNASLRRVRPSPRRRWRMCAV